MSARQNEEMFYAILDALPIQPVDRQAAGARFALERHARRHRRHPYRKYQPLGGYTALTFVTVIDGKVARLSMILRPRSLSSLKRRRASLRGSSQFAVVRIGKVVIR